MVVGFAFDRLEYFGWPRGTVFIPYSVLRTMTALPFETEITVRYSDLDTLGHVNNASYATYLEEARLAYFEEVVDDPMDENSMVVANMDLDFHAPVEERSVTVGVGIRDVGDRSFVFEYELVSGGVTVLTGSTVQVRVDPETGDSLAVSDEWREAFERTRV